MSRVLDVEISLVNTDNRELLRACLDSLPAACDGLDWHVTVVDNASEDESAEMVEREYPRATLLKNRRRLGATGNQNQVIQSVLTQDSARYVLLLNEDTELHPGSVRNLVRFCDERPGIGLASPRLLHPSGAPLPTLIGLPTLADEFWTALRPGRAPLIPEVGYIPTCCSLVRTEALHEIGPLDELFFIFYDDTDLCARLHDAGWESAVCPDASIVHHEHQTIGKPAISRDMERQMMRSRYLYFRKHRGSAEAKIVASLCRAALVARLAKALLLRAAKRDPMEREKAGRLWNVIRYDPRIPLPHERRLGDPSGGS